MDSLQANVSGSIQWVLMQTGEADAMSDAFAKFIHDVSKKVRISGRTELTATSTLHITVVHSCVFLTGFFQRLREWFATV